MADAALVAEWLRFATMDLEGAQYLMQMPHRKPFEIICYHCQQCVEKALKAYLIAQDAVAPRIHDLGDLCQRCVALDETFAAFIADCDELTLYVTHARYPSKVEIEERDVTSALQMAEQICSFCVARIQRLELDPPAPEEK